MPAHFIVHVGVVMLAQISHPDQQLSVEQCICHLLLMAREEQAKFVQTGCRDGHFGLRSGFHIP